MKRTLGIRRWLLLVAGLTILASMSIPSGLRQHARASARAARIRKIEYHRGQAKLRAKQASAYIPWRDWDRDYKRMLEEVAAWHAGRAEVYRNLDDDSFEDQDLIDGLGEKDRMSRLEKKYDEQPNWY